MGDCVVRLKIARSVAADNGRRGGYVCLSSWEAGCSSAAVISQFSCLEGGEDKDQWRGLGGRGRRIAMVRDG